MQAHTHGIHLESINFGFDVLLVIIGFVMAYAATKIPSVGAIGKTVRYVVIGAIILGFAHLIETGISSFFKIDNELNELIHRGIILLAFSFLYFGIKGLADSLSKLRSAAAAAKR
jgi:membrane-bound ClpP family serine protease